MDHCDCLPSLPGTLLQQMGADAARPCLSPTLLPGHSSHSSPGQQCPAQASEAMPIRHTCVFAHSTCILRQAAARQQTPQHPSQASPSAPLGPATWPAEGEAGASCRQCCSGENPHAKDASPGRGHLMLASRLAAASMMQDCLGHTCAEVPPAASAPRRAEAGGLSGGLPLSELSARAAAAVCSGAAWAELCVGQTPPSQPLRACSSGRYQLTAWLLLADDSCSCAGCPACGLCILSMPWLQALAAGKPSVVMAAAAQRS